MTAGDDPPSELLECSFLIPLVRDGDRTPHQPLCWRSLEDTLYEAFGGSSGPDLIYRGLRPSQGEYQNDVGTHVRDESWRYIAAVPRSRLDELRMILRRAANTFDQEAIYLSVAGIVEFVRGAQEDGFLI